MSLGAPGYHSMSPERAPMSRPPTWEDPAEGMLNVQTVDEETSGSESTMPAMREIPEDSGAAIAWGIIAFVVWVIVAAIVALVWWAL
jgi:hypothetical protein